MKLLFEIPCQKWIWFDEFRFHKENDYENSHRIYSRNHGNMKKLPDAIAAARLYRTL